MRPQKHRCVKFDPATTYFKPNKIPLYNLEEKSLTIDELETIRLCDFLGKSHEEAGASMQVSRATIGRIIQKARKKIAEALIFGKAIKIKGGQYQIPKEDCLCCDKCSYVDKTAGSRKCPKCTIERRKKKKCCEFSY